MFQPDSDSIFMHTKGLTYSDHIVPYVGGREKKKKQILSTQTEATLEGKIKRGKSVCRWS